MANPESKDTQIKPEEFKLHMYGPRGLTPEAYEQWFEDNPIPSLPLAHPQTPAG